MKKLLVYGLTKNLGGIENFIYNHIINFDFSKFEIHFLVYEKPVFYEELENLGCKFHFVPRRGENIIENRKAVEVLFKKNIFDIFWFNVCTLTYIYPLQIASKYKVKKKVIHVHCPSASGGWKMKLFHQLNKPKIEKISDLFFACSKGAADFSFDSSIQNSEKYKLILNAIDVDKYNYNEKYREEIVSEFNIPQKNIISHVGHFLDVKNHIFLIDVLEELVKLNQDYHLILVGTGNLQKDIESKVEKLGLKKNVTFAGRRLDIYKILSASNLFVFPSKYEGLSLSLVEAQSSGLTCVISDSISIENDLTGNTKFISLNESPLTWAKVIDENINNHRDNNVIKIKEKGFDIKTNVNMIEKMFLEES